MNRNADPETRQDRRTEKARILKLVRAMQRRAPLDAVKHLAREEDASIVKVLKQLDPIFAFQLFKHLPEERQQTILPAMPSDLGAQWQINQAYPEDSVGRLMEKPVAIFQPDTSVGDAIKTIRRLARTHMFTYAYVIDGQERLLGVVVMRDLLLAKRSDTLADIMIIEPFHFTPDMPVGEAVREVIHRHYPVYPVCDGEQRLIGLVHGYVLFEQHTVEISAQAGRMVGITNEEHITTSWLTSLRLRHPWLQLNIVTAFLAAFVVGIFESTIAQIVALAVFLPVLAGQSGNTGSQAQAVTLRGITLKEFKPGLERKVLSKEALLGLANGALVGVTAGTGMFAYATITGAPQPLGLALVVLLAMMGSCVASGLTGVMVPLTLKRLGADPATASSIFLTTATDVISMGLLLGLATLLIL